MPQFHLDTSGSIACPSASDPSAPCICYARTWEQLDAFTQGYIEALFFTDSGPDDGQLGDAGFADLAPETLEAIIADCANFQAAAAPLLARAAVRHYSDERAGHDFWLTRNGHGAGFWDRNELAKDALGDLLSDVAKRYGSRDTYLGDDGKVYAT